MAPMTSVIPLIPLYGLDVALLAFDRSPVTAP